MTWLQYLGFAGLALIPVGFIIYCKVRYPEGGDYPNQIDPYDLP